MAGEPTRKLVRRLAEARGEAYSLTGVAKRQVSPDIETAIVSGRAGPDWSSLAERAGVQVSEEDLRAQGSSRHDREAIRASYAGEGW
jgi:hypothetical protein